jgi:hypothetical protein
MEGDERTATGCAGFFVAPFAAGAVGSITAVILGNDPILGSAGTAANVVGLFFYGLILGFPGVILFGIPLHFLLKRLRISSAFVYVGMATLSGALIYELTAANLMGLSYQGSNWPRIAVQIPMAIAGGASGLLFWIVARPDRNLSQR